MRLNISSGVLVTSYLGAIVMANLVATHWGQTGLLIGAALLLPFDFVARDLLHERWRGSAIWARMLALVTAGGVITIAINPASNRVVAASVVALVVGMMVDTSLYQRWWAQPVFRRMCATNAVTSFVDSLIFPLIAFGALSLPVLCLQNALKLGGSIVWAIVFTRWILLRRSSPDRAIDTPLPICDK